MKWKCIILTSILSFGLGMKSTTVVAGIISDTCTFSDICDLSLDIAVITADEPFLCIEGCNLNATPEVFNNSCHIGLFPTVWYSLFADGGSLINIQVSSNDIEAPVITLFQVITGCDDLVQIPLASNNVQCVVGSNGVAEAFGTDIGSNLFYVIAISSLDAVGGEFTLCVNTVSKASVCVLDRNLTIEARSIGEDLSGPFLPGETVSVCMNVNEYTAFDNDCQWFQGLVPVFGNGWDPSSFDADGQPINATLNGNPIGATSNGVYGPTTWDWFTDVDYHFDDPSRQIGDFDGNGTVDMCSITYDPDCPDMGGLSGACCGPCWGSPLGTILPPGWFAYGTDGSCNIPGPPIRVDWGDGAFCSGPMGPWKFCFDLTIRAYPECQTDQTTRDLSIGFFTFSDGEVGAWTGEASVCAMDQPLKLSLPFACDQITDLGVEFVEDKCAGSVFDYVISAPGIENWKWSISPFNAAKPSPKEGENGYFIHDTLVNASSSPIEVIYYFTGEEEATSNYVIKQVRFRIIPEIRSSIPDLIYLCEKDKDTLTISAEPITGGLAPFQFLWNPGGETSSSISIFPPFQSGAYALNIIDSIGCTFQQQIKLKVTPCHLDTIMPEDESNDHHTFDDPPVVIGKSGNPGTHHPSTTIETVGLKVYPIPATDFVYIKWPPQVTDWTTLEILDIQGNFIHRTTPSGPERDDHFSKLDVQLFTDGVYIVILRTSSAIYTAKFLKM